MLDKLRVFIKVAQAGSFSKAAKQLHMAPSSITRKIDQLEQQLGVTLFKRSTRQLLLTEPGQTLLQGSGRVLADLDGLLASLNHEQQAPSGHLSISVFESFGRLHVLPLLPDFLRRYPQVDVQIELENRKVDVVADDVDLAIRIGRPEDSSLKARRLLSNQVELYATEDYLQKHGVPETPRQLSQHNCLTLNRHRQQTHWYFSRGQQQQKVQVSGNLVSTGGTPLVAMVAAGIGIALLPRWLLKDYQQSDCFRPLLSEWQASIYPEGSGDIYGVFDNQKTIKPALRAFIDFLVERLATV